MTTFAIYSSDDFDPGYVRFDGAYEAACEYLDIVKGTKAQAYIIESEEDETIVNVWEIVDNKTKAYKKQNPYDWYVLDDIYYTNI